MMAYHRKAARVLLFLATMVSLPACSSSYGTSAARDFDAAPMALNVTVENRNISMARVFLVAPGFRRRLGAVAAHQRTSFVVDASFPESSGELSLETELLGTREVHRTEPFRALAGDQIEFVIGQRPQYSRVVVVR